MEGGAQSQAPDRLTLAAFGVAVLLGAGNFIAVRYSNDELPPFWGAGLRFGCAALLFILVTRFMRLRWPRGQDLRATALYGVFSFTLVYALMYWALVRVSAGAATIVMAIVPLVALLLAAAQGLEKLRGRAVLGAVLALAGILWITLGPQDIELPWDAVVAMLAAAACAGESIILGKRVSGQHPAVTNAVGMSIGALGLLAISLVAGEAWALPREPASAFAVIYLVLLGSMALFILVLLVVRRWTVSATSYLFVLFPVATLVMDAILRGEPITPVAVSGAVLVMAGVWFGALSPAARRSAAASGPPPIVPPVAETT